MLVGHLTAEQSAPARNEVCEESARDQRLAVQPCLPQPILQFAESERERLIIENSMILAKGKNVSVGPPR
jgi:hypothetical protein